MKHKLLFLFLALVFSSIVIPQSIPPPVCGISEINACDNDSDGMALIDITIYDDIYPFCMAFADPDDYYIPTHHLSQEDADAGINPINNPQTFVGTNGQYIYMRAEPLNSGTHSVLSFLTYELVVENCLSSPEITLQNIKIYPNPVSDFLNIKLENSIYKILIIEIIDLKGKQVLNQNLEGTTLNVSQLNPGIYFLKVKDKNSYKKTFKVIKE